MILNKKKTVLLQKTLKSFKIFWTDTQESPKITLDKLTCQQFFVAPKKLSNFTLDIVQHRLNCDLGNTAILA